MMYDDENDEYLGLISLLEPIPGYVPPWVSGGGSGSGTPTTVQDPGVGWSTPFYYGVTIAPPIALDPTGTPAATPVTATPAAPAVGTVTPGTTNAPTTPAAEQLIDGIDNKYLLYGGIALAAFLLLRGKD